MSRRKKILFICIDGADKDLILKWADSGLLPTWQSLLQKGACGITKDPSGINGCHWPTFFSGISPVHHGRYWAQQIQPGTYNISSFSFNWEPFWEILSRAGLKVGLINPPEAPLAEELKGIQIVERHNYKYKNSSFQTYPSSLKAEIETKFGENPIGSLRTAGRSLVDLQNFCQNLMTSVDKTTKLASDFLKQDEYDFFLVAFRESHWAGHECWHLHDPNHPEHNQQILNSLGNPIKDIYIAIDAGIGKILQQVNPETTVFVFASTGIGPNYTGVHLLDDILLRLENPRISKSKGFNKSILNSLKQYKFLRQLKKQIWNPMRSGSGKQKKAIAGKSNRKCFQVPSTEAYGAIRINLIDREPHGKIQAGQEYEAFCEELIRDLSAIVNLNTGEPLIKNILRSEEIYQGKQPMGCPDLLIEWNRNAPISSVASPKIGRIDKVYWDSRTGDHKPGGLFSIFGPSIEPRKLEEPTSIIDFAPTIASLLGIKLPTSDGQILSII